MTPEELMKQASITSHDYALEALHGLSGLLGIDLKKEGWEDKLAPFAVVWAAMIRTAAADFDTAIGYGMADSLKPGD